MSLDVYGAEMTEGEVADFLEEHGLGVLSFGNEEGGYGIPMSFGYDRDERCCVFQFVSGENDTKTAFIEEGNDVTLTVVDWESVSEWQSVVLRGRLRPIADEASVEAASIFASFAHVASLEVFQQPLQELNLEWYELHIEEMHGRHAV